MRLRPVVLLIAASVLFSSCQLKWRDKRLLTEGTSVLQELKSGETHTYRVQVPTGSVCEIRADQIGVDLMLRVSGRGTPPYEVDRWSSPASFESMEVLSEWGTELRLDIISRDKDRPLGRYRLSLVKCRTASDQDRRRISRRKDAFSYYLVGQKNRESDNPTEVQGALEAYRQALPMLADAGDALGAATATLYVGESLANLGDQSGALAYYEQALKMLQPLGDPDSTAEALHNVATKIYEQGDLDRALILYEQAMPRWSEAGDALGEAATLSNIGRVFDSRGEYAKALEAYNEAGRLALAAGDKSWQAHIQHNVGMVLLALGAIDDAIREYNTAIRLSREINDTWSESHFRHHLGEALIQKGDLDEAERQLNQSLEAGVAVGDALGKATTLVHLGEIEHRRGNHERALLDFQEGLRIRSEKKYRLGESQALNLVGRELLCLQRTEEAKLIMEQALSVALAIKEPRSAAQAMSGLADVYRKQRRYAEALSQIERAIATVEGLRTNIRQHELRSLFVSTIYDYYEAARDISLLQDSQAPHKPNGARAFSYAERSRARSLLDAMRWQENQGLNSRNRNAGPTEQLQSLYERRLLMLSQNVRPEELRGLDLRIAKLRSQHGVNGATRYSGITTGNVSKGEELISTIRSSLTGPKKAFLEFSLGKEQSYLWAITQRKSRLFILPPRDQIEGLARRYLDHLRLTAERVSQPTTVNGTPTTPDPYLPDAVALSRATLGPAWSEIKDLQLVIVPDGQLHYVPFAALPMPTCDSSSPASCDPLLITHDVSYVASGTFAVLLRHQKVQSSTAERNVLVIADPVYNAQDVRLQLSGDSQGGCGRGQSADAGQPSRNTLSGTRSFRRLLYSQEELNALVKMLPSNQVTVMSGWDASVSRLLSTKLDDFTIVHIAAHAVADPSRFDGSGVVLSTYNRCGNPVAAFLPASRIAELNLASSGLVVLSTCDSALGRNVRGEGLTGLAYSFQLAGASSVVASLWRVQDDATATLMKYFYLALLQRKLPPSAALRFAQETLFREYPAWHDPVFWGAFIVEGDAAIAP